MQAVHGIEHLAAGDGRHHLSRTLGPALLLSVGYINLGKWVATVDAGSRFGYDLVLLVLLFNFAAVLCQYLSICIGMVTGKNLAEICRQEYSRSICVVLGIQATISLFTSELTMISGIAVGFNLVFEHDLMTGIIFASVVANLLPYVISSRDKRMAGTLNACIAGFVILLFVLGLLVSQPEIPIDMNVMFPKLSGESAYSLMALMGANIIAHNFYVHSSVGQAQRRSHVLTLGALFHDHLFSVLFIFTGIFLVNYVLLSSAAVESHNNMILNYHDAVELMNQIFTNPMAPLVLLVVVLFSSHIISLTSIISSRVIVENFFGLKMPLSAHHLVLKGLSMIPIIYCAKLAGSEGIYQLLILCPVIQAMLLPPSVIPVFRVASSRSLMGSYRISLYVEIFAFLAFLLMLFTNIIFAAEILFGDSSWTNNLKGNTESPMILPHAVIILMSCASIAFTLFLASTPLKSASNEAESHGLDITHDREDTSPEHVAHEQMQRSSIDAVQRKSLETNQKPAFEHIGSFETIEDSDHGIQQSIGYLPQAHSLTSVNDRMSELDVGGDWTDPTPKVSTASVSKTGTIKMESTAEQDLEKDTEASRSVNVEKSAGGNLPSLSSNDPTSLTLSCVKDADAGHGNGSPSKLPGFGRAGRRQLAAILDDFWGHFFDYHGKLTQDATAKKFNFLLGLDLVTDSSALRTDDQSMEATKSSLVRVTVPGSATSWDSTSRDTKFSSPKSTLELQTGAIGPSTRSQSMYSGSSTDISSPTSTLIEQNARFYSNFDVPSYSGNQLYQPATVHGYQLGSYLKGTKASRSPHSSIPLDARRLPIASGSAPNFANSVIHVGNQNVFGSPGPASSQSPTMNLNSMMVESSFYDPTSFVGSGSDGSSAYSKKYHSSPDISALIAASRNTLLNKANSGHAAGKQPYLSRLASERSYYEHSPYNAQGDGLTIQPSTKTNTKSLWSQQSFEKLFGVPSAELSKSRINTSRRSSSAKDDFSYTGGGWDEVLIDHVAAAERVSQRTTGVRDANCMRGRPNCGDDCVWQASLVISFGVWCIRRVLDLSYWESRPELWGKYTYVLNRLQGILDPAFSKPRKPLTWCTCLEQNDLVAKLMPGTFTTAAVILEVIKDVEQAVSGRKGRSGTTAGDVAFPKGKENLASVLKRYKRRLSSKPSA